MSFRRITVCLAITIVFVCTAICAGEQLETDLADGRLDHHTLLEAASTIGEMNSSETIDAQRRIQSLVASLDKQQHNNSIDRLHALLSLMHDRVFTGQYDTAASQISTTFSNGDYNCASSAVLFLVAADVAGFSARAVLLPGHVRCRVWIEEDQRWFDIEPSVRLGKATRERSDVLESHMPNADQRELTEVQLLAKLYYNRGIDELTNRDYWSALRHARDAWELDTRHAAAGDNVAAIVNNWSLSLCQQGKFEEALRLIHDGLRESPDNRLLSVNEIHIYVTWMQELTRSGDLRGVEMRLHEALARYPDCNMLRSIDHRLRQANLSR